MIFNKSGKTLTKFKFEINGIELENVSSYTYLGLKINTTGKLHKAQEDLRHRALKAYFKMKQLIYTENSIPIKTYIKLFDTMVKPILLYCCEIWTSNSLWEPKNIFNISLPMERLHNKFCKFILQVSSKASNLACLLELGRYPLLLTCIKHMLKYWERIKQMPKNTLLNEAYSLGTQLDNNNIPNWTTGIKNILRLTDMNDIWEKNTHDEKQNIYAIVLEKLKLNFATYSKKTMYDDNKGDKHRNKLRTYRLFKTDFMMENYLQAEKNPTYRSAMTRLRISAHTLRIEVGRHHNIKLKNRTCPVCDTNEIEDEEHFLIRCKLYKNERNNTFDQILPNCNLSDSEKLVSLLTNKNEKHIHKLTKFIDTCFKRREEYLKQVPAATC